MKTIKISIHPYAKKRESIAVGLIVNGPFIEGFCGAAEERKLKFQIKREGEHKDSKTTHYYTIEVSDDFQGDIAKKTVEWSRGRQFHKYEVIYNHREQ